jgi:hypothetical protein
MNLNRFYKIVLAALFAAQSFLAVAQTNDTAAPVDFSTFSGFIAKRNIFDPNRMPIIGSVKVTQNIRFRQTPLTDSFSLVGAIGYGEGKLAGIYALFDGTSLQYQKSAQLNDTIATFKISVITADSVTLVTGTNTLVLGIGEQLHDAGGGHWVFANGTTVGYNTLGNYSNLRNGRNGNGNGGRRRNNNNLGNGNNGNFNNANPGRRRNNNGTAGPPDNSPPPDPNLIPVDNGPQDNGAAPDDNNAQGTVPQDNIAAPDTQPPSAPSGDLADPIAKLKAARAAELQNIGH